MIDARRLVGHVDMAWIVLDSLRYDVAHSMLAAGRTPHLARVLEGRPWEERHSPATFTLPAHQAFFAGFLPTPVSPGQHTRLFAARFAGSETTGAETCVFDQPDVVSGLAGRGYRTVCVGGVGFFNPRSPLGRVLPAYFQESHWSPRLGVSEADSTRHQVDLALETLRRTDDRLFLFMNVSAIHQPNRHFLEGCTRDCADSQGAALAYVDSQLGRFFEAWRARGPSLLLIFSDHGTCYGEDGYWGHRRAHRAVFSVPYAEVCWPPPGPPPSPV